MARAALYIIGTVVEEISRRLQLGTNHSLRLRHRGQHYIDDLHPGQYRDEETGLNQNYFRDYDPKTGRYIQADPIGLAGGVNLYGYVEGNPIKRRDPLGLWSGPGHNYFIEEAYPELSSVEIKAIQAGSEEADSMINQISARAYIHSMTSEVLSETESILEKELFIQQHMNEFKKWYCRSLKEKNAYWATGQRRYAFKQLGMALHPPMDSTSPAHRGYQKWKIGNVTLHGDILSPRSLEKLSEAPWYRDETVTLMRRLYTPGSVDCNCEN